MLLSPMILAGLPFMARIWKICTLGSGSTRANQLAHSTNNAASTAPTIIARVAIAYSSSASVGLIIITSSSSGRKFISGNIRRVYRTIRQWDFERVPGLVHGLQKVLAVVGAL